MRNKLLKQLDLAFYPLSQLIITLLAGAKDRMKVTRALDDWDRRIGRPVTSGEHMNEVLSRQKLDRHWAA